MRALSAESSWKIYGYSRHLSDQSIAGVTSCFADLSIPTTFSPAGNKNLRNIWVSFVPIWLFAYFFEMLAINFPDRLDGIDGLIICSSSSAITKRFSFNHFDSLLAKNLVDAEDKILLICRKLNIPCIILRPSLIYGKAGAFRDKNISLLMNLAKIFPVLPMPADSGLRQPIHCSQLAGIALKFAQQMSLNDTRSLLPDRISVGGDTILSYTQIVSELQKRSCVGFFFLFSCNFTDS